MHVLVVEDDKRIREYIEKGLKQEGYVVDTANDGEDGLHLALATNFDIIVLDVMLPKMSGVEITRELRARDHRTPILMLSALDSIDDRVKGLQIGSDDYLTKPFAFSELNARIQALLRRSQKTSNPTVLNSSNVQLDLTRRTVKLRGKEVILQPKEFALLEYLMRNTGKIVSRTMIMENVWGYSFDPKTNVVESRISKLRGKLDDSMIRTVRGAGYTFDD